MHMPRGWVHVSGFPAVHQALGELVQAADVVPVDVRRHGGDRLVHQIGDLARQRRHSQARVYEQVSVSTAYVPDIAADQRVDVRLEEQGHPVLEAPALPPAVGHSQHHPPSPVRSLRPCISWRSEGGQAMLEIGRVNETYRDLVEGA